MLCSRLSVSLIYIYIYICIWASLVAQTVKNLPAMQETQTEVQSLVEKIPWRREWQPTPIALAGEFHGQRSQSVGLQRVGPTERLSLIFFRVCVYIYIYTHTMYIYTHTVFYFNLSPPSLFLLVTISLFSTSVSLFLFCK